MRILLVEPYYGGSHRQWADGYRRFSAHEVILVTHEARFWKWRMEGGALTLAMAIDEAIATHGDPDVVMASSMVNLPSVLGLARRTLKDVPTVLYMHENQITYPVSHLGAEDLTHAMINWLSVAAADEVWFNSQFHLDDFFGSVPELLGRFPDHRHSAHVDAARERSSVQPVGVDLRRLDAIDPDRGDPALVLWNQRWEHDKNPEEFFAALRALADDGVEYRVALAGEVFSTTPGIFEEARDELGERVVHFGFAEPAVYDRLLKQADVVVSTAHHEFFGVAIVEAIYAGAAPVLPNRLAYPEHVPEELHDRVLYDDFDGLIERLRRALEGDGPRLSDSVARYDWRDVAPRYDSAMESLAT